MADNTALIAELRTLAAGHEHWLPFRRAAAALERAEAEQNALKEWISRLPSHMQPPAQPDPTDWYFEKGYIPDGPHK